MTASDDARLEWRWLTDSQRLDAISRLRPKLHESSETLDAFTRLACDSTGSPFAQISIIGAAQSVPSSCGLEADKSALTPAAESLCSVTIASGGPLAIADASQHPWVRELPPVTSGKVGSYLGVPVFAADGVAAGAICVFSPEPHEWNDSDVRSMVDLANLVNRELAHHAGDGVQSLMIESLGDTLQNLVLPTALPDVPGVEMCARYAPASGGLMIGGDWYDCFRLDDDRISLAVGDVAGHGIQAAATMAQVRSALRAYALVGGSPSVVVGQLEYLVSEIEPETLIALAFGELDPGTGLVRLIVAGLTPPLVIANGVAKFLRGAAAPPLNAGVSPGDVWVEQQVRLEPGDALVLFSDGLVERRGIGLDTCLERLRLYAETIGPETAAKDFCNDIVDEMTGTSLTEDDVCVLVVRYLGRDHL